MGYESDTEKKKNVEKKEMIEGRKEGMSYVSSG